MDQQLWPLNASGNVFMAAQTGDVSETESLIEGHLPVRHKTILAAISSLQKGIVVENGHAVSDSTSRPKVGFEFVDVSTSSQAEKERNRARIRSRAAMKISRQEGPSKPSSCQKRQSKPLPEAKPGASVRRDGDTVAKSYGSLALIRTPKSGSDPFRLYPTDQRFPHADFLLDHSTGVLWPTLLPTIVEKGGSSHRSAWLERALSHPLALHGLLFGAISHLNFLRTRNHAPLADMSRRILLLHKAETLRLVNEELQSPSVKNLDDVLLAVLALSTNEADSDPPNHVRVHSPFHPPFADAQWISIYGNMVQNKVHVAGMVAIVKMRGGLDKIEWPGLAGIISYGDIIGATQDFRHPYFPLPISANPPTSAPNKHSGMHKLETSTAPSFGVASSLGIAFTTDLLNSSDLPPMFFTAICAVIDYSILLEKWSRGIAAVPTIFDLTSRRNAVQHGLLSLPTAAEMNFPKGTAFYDSLRLGALLYSVAVMFPLPPSTGVLHGLVVRLTSTILAALSENSLGLFQEGLEGKGWEGFERTFLWLGVLGGIASEGMVERTLFVDIVRDLSRELGLETWHQVVREMERYLWLESACDCGGRDFWAEVVSKEGSLISDFRGSSEGRKL